MRSKLTEVIEPSQFAYKTHIGTVDASIKLLDDITSELDNHYIKVAHWNFQRHAIDCNLQHLITIVEFRFHHSLL